MARVVLCAGQCGAFIPADTEPVTIRPSSGKGWVKVLLCPDCERRMHDFRRKVQTKRQPALR